MPKFFLKIISIFFLVFFFLLKNPYEIKAEGEFLVDASVEYYLQEDGTTRVTHNLTLENAFPTLYAKSYSLNLENIEPKNAQAFEDDEALNLVETRTDNQATLQVNFPDSLVGKGEKRNFAIIFEVNDFAIRTGEVWEISIPKLDKPDSYRNYSVIISVPLKLGNEAYISPQPKSKYNTYNRTNLVYDKQTIAKTGITAGFGEFQVFSFTLNYHLENPLNRRAETEIAIPPDTAFQKVYYQLIEPIPSSIRVDADGNWLALYELNKRERIDVKAVGSVQIYAKERKFIVPTVETLENNRTANEFWQADNSEIIRIASELKTTRNIYDFVTTKLTYDYKRVKPNEVRMGALEALNNPENAICMEFTDLFIALARAAGIPAREINGFAYTENPEIQPLSLVSDVLHSWPEYWDENKLIWVPVDPTWGSTTGGIDYFSKLDLRHFTFVIHGTDSSKPYAPGSYKLGPNPQKDVFVNFGKLTGNFSPDLNVTARVVNKIPLISATVSVSVKNSGPSALYDTTPSVYFDDKKTSFANIQVLPPFNTYQFEFKIPLSFLGTSTPDKIKIIVADKTLELSGYKQFSVLTSLVFLFIMLTGIVIAIVLKFKKNIVKLIFLKFKNAFKFKKNTERKT